MGKTAESPATPARARRMPLALLTLLLFLFSCCFQYVRSDAKKLDPREVTALREVAKKLKINATVWDFDVEPCNWTHWSSSNLTLRNFTCDNCNTTTNVCHVVNIVLKGHNLTGALPEEFGNLTSLVELDLTRNYISGPIPAASWASSPLRKISLSANRLSGPIPEAIERITTLRSLEIENNMMEGRLPGSLGNLKNLTRLLLSGNNFTGQLPDTLGNLKNLTDFRIDGSGVSGKIPSFVSNWTKLQRLDMQGTSLEGPFPSNISLLKELTDLRITDLKKSDGNFPPLENMKNMKHLVLRNCSISGQIPDYIQRMTTLKTLDLSFNNLTGGIPGLQGLNSLRRMYLTNNRLNGSLPKWIQTSTHMLDVSYNTFTDLTSAPPNCGGENLNYVASFSSVQSNSLATCLRKDLSCGEKPTHYEFYINCGGSKVIADGKEYDDDTQTQGGSSFFNSPSRKWAFSSTGDFGDEDNAKYIAGNASTLAMPNKELYMTARLNPLSLKYYGLCMQNGNYTVKLHFAEIIFTDDQTFLANGRRLFDISIQGKKVLEDFNIAQAANGTHKEIVKTFTTLVEHSTLEIHFQWLGKGTNAIPKRGFYGPLISAIEVTPNFKPMLDKLSIGAIVGIVVASCMLAILILVLLWLYLRRRNTKNNELRGLQLQTGYFSLKQIKSATKDFSPSNKIGEGGFGPVYKGVLPDGSAIAVKQLSSKSKQGNREFVNEIGMISALQHPNLVKLFGCCIEGNQLLLIYEYMENNSLARALFGPESLRMKLDWETRHKICLDIARGLAYLHEESRLKIVHRDIKATNILLDKDLKAKISDFGLAKLDEEENTHISTRIAGTMGYMAPEYAMRGYLTDKADVYSFGVVLLEIVSGRSNTIYRPKEENFHLLDQAYVLQEQGKLLELVDPSLGENYSKEEVQQMLNLVLLCTNPSPTLRPSMSAVVSMLEKQIPVQVPSVRHTQQGSGEMRLKSSENISYDSQKHNTSMGAPWTDSRASVHGSKVDIISYSSTSKSFENISYDSQEHITSMDAPWTDDSTASVPSSKVDTTFYSSTSKLLSDCKELC